MNGGIVKIGEGALFHWKKLQSPPFNKHWNLDAPQKSMAQLYLIYIYKI